MIKGEQLLGTKAWEREIFLFCFSCFFSLILIRKWCPTS